MGGKDRARRIVEQVTIENEDFRQAVENFDSSQMLLKALFNIFEKCGNCRWRHECIDRTLTAIQDRTSIDFEDRAVDAMTFLLEFYESELTDDQRETLTAGLFDVLDIEGDNILDALDEVFSECRAYTPVAYASKQKRGSEDDGR